MLPTQHTRKRSVTFSPERFAIVIAHRFVRLRYADNGQQPEKRDRAERFRTQHRAAKVQKNRLKLRRPVRFGHQRSVRRADRRK